MPFDYVDRFIVLFCGGAGMALAGGLNALAGRLAVGWRAVLTGAGCGVALGGVATFTSDPNVLVAAAAVMAVGVVPTLLAGSASLVGLARCAAALAVRPGVRWGLLAAVGVGTAVGSVAWYEYEDAARTDRDMQELGLEFGRAAAGRFGRQRSPGPTGAPRSRASCRPPRGPTRRSARSSGGSSRRRRSAIR